MIAIAEERARGEQLAGEFTTDASALQDRRWPLVTAIGVLDYYPDPVPMLRTFREHMEPDGRLVVTFPNALSPFGWAFWAGSRLTYPVTPRTPSFARRAAAEARLRVLALRFAAPTVAGLGHTLVLELARE
jgi:2-polyprenyl-3-methyl-5-hydroxy-6-metoxy-1,4-benzoquinol methylase